MTAILSESFPGELDVCDFCVGAYPEDLQRALHVVGEHRCILTALRLTIERPDWVTIEHANVIREIELHCGQFVGAPLAGDGQRNVPTNAVRPSTVEYVIQRVLDDAERRGVLRRWQRDDLHRFVVEHMTVNGQPLKWWARGYS